MLTDTSGDGAEGNIGKESRRCLLDLMAKSWFSAF